MCGVRGKSISMIFQEPMSSLNPVLTVGEQVAEVFTAHKVCGKREAAERAVEWLRKVHLPDPERRAREYPHQMSGGMRQRAMIAMALACSPDLLFADEPTTALDVMIQAQVFELFKRIQAEFGLAIVLVTHDLGVVAEMCDVVVVMYGGMVAEVGPVDSVYNEPQHPYTQRLLAAFPDPSRSADLPAGGQDLATIPGTPPRLNALPPGCRFEPRCERRIDRCTEASPALVDVAVPGSDARHLAACHLLGEPEAGDA